ncbi:SH3 domain-containing protein [Lachnospiraceae bacterium C1.1]|nr:SH3 domain-containing protein [Lachnospiraceae bacterium C1.1]
MIIKRKSLIAASLVISVLFSTETFAGVTLMPEVKDEMLSPQYWTAESFSDNKALANASEIKKLNESFINEENCNMNNLIGERSLFDGVSLNRARWRAGMSEMSGFLDGAYYDIDGNTVSGQYAMDIVKNVEDPNATDSQRLRYGICVHRSDIRVFPTELIIADDPGDNDFDNLQNSGIRVGEPVTIYAESEDGKYYYCHNSCVSGWIPSEDIAVCRSKSEWLSAWQIPDDKAIVVTDGKIFLEESNTSPELSGLMLTMGTVLKKADPSDYDKLVTNRSLYYNYPVWVPVRDSDGMYDKKLALISTHQNIHDGYLPLTYDNILTVAYSMLGDSYGWGGMLSSVDCSQYVRDIYKCFNLELPRNTTWQAAMPVEKYDMENADRDTKKKFLDELAPGAILFFKGHEMLYLGHCGDNYYVISSVSSMLDPEGTEKARIRNIVINTLDAKRANGNLWLDDIYEAAVPYSPNPENLAKSISENSVSDDSVSGNNVSGTSVSSNCVSDDSVSANS